MRWFSLFTLTATWAIQKVMVFASDGATGGDTFSVGTLIVQIGLSGIFLWQWRTERDQRQKRDDQMVAILERQGPVLSQAIEVLKAVQESQKSVITRSSMDWDEIAEKLRSISESLDADIQKRKR